MQKKRLKLRAVSEKPTADHTHVTVI